MLHPCVHKLRFNSDLTGIWSPQAATIPEKLQGLDRQLWWSRVRPFASGYVPTTESGFIQAAIYFWLSGFENLHASSHRSSLLLRLLQDGDDGGRILPFVFLWHCAAAA